MNKFLSVLAIIWLSVGSLLAQNRTVTGKVTSGDDGSPLPGVNIVVKNTVSGVTSGADGTFSINVPDNVILVFSFVGYTIQEVPVGNRTTVDVILQPDVTTLQEVVFTGYGAQNKREISGSITKVKSEEISNLPVQSFDRALQGRAAGVLVLSNSGAPGSNVTVRIRGTGSITAGNEPLYIVDGQQISSTSANNVSNTANASNNPLNFLNPNDIESIEIIRDAATASIYGSAAANGVVIVTTKKGKSGKTKFNLNLYSGFVEPIKLLDVLNTQEYIQVRSEAIFNQQRASNASYEFVTAQRVVLGELGLPATLTTDEIAALPTYDWQKEAYKTGSVNNVEFSASGGNEKTTFSFSGSYSQQDANLINIDFKRGAVALRLSNKINNILSFESSLNISSSSQRGPFGGPAGGSFLGSAAFSAPLILPSNPIFNTDGSLTGVAPNSLSGVLNQNVLLVASVNKIRNRTDQIVGYFSPLIQLAKGLTLKPFASIDYRISKGYNNQSPLTSDAFAVGGRVSEERGENINFLTNAVLSYNTTIAEKHSLGVLTGVEYRSETYDEIFSAGTGLVTIENATLTNTSVQETLTGFATGYKRAGVFGKLQYDFSGKYFLTGNLRYDGSSRFGTNNQYGLFPGIAASWLASEESFIKKYSFISFLKLRAGYGVTGNDQIGNFSSRNLYSTGTNYSQQPGVVPNSLGLSDLRWERNKTTEGGLEFGLFRDAVVAEIGYFNRTSSDLLLDVQTPWTNGYDNLTRNLGEVVNKGWEFSLTTRNLKRPDFEWTTTFNISVIDNKVTKLYDGITKQANPDSLTLITVGNVFGVGQNIAIGYPIGVLYTARYAGVNPSNGRPMWYDGFGNITYQISTPRDSKIVGDGFAEVFGGLNNKITYKGFTLNTFFQGEFGREATNGLRAFAAENGGRTFNVLQEFYDSRWQKPGDITSVPRPYNGNAEIRGSNQTAGSRFIEDASYIRLKEISLSYSLPKTILTALKIENVSLYGRILNAYTWTKWSGFDPEFANLGNGNNGQIPQTKQFIFGIQIGL